MKHFRFRKYYKDQLELIASIEDILVQKDDATTNGEDHKRTTKILTKATLIINIVCLPLFRHSFIDFLLSKILVTIKIAGAVISGSLSIISSVVDSVVDLLTGIILIWAARKIKNRNIYKYPEGQLSLHLFK
jgi:hypothetical protein